MCQLTAFSLYPLCTAATKLAPQQNRQGYASGLFDPLFSGSPALSFLLAAFGYFTSQWSIIRIFQAFAC
jgi:hypothetical protein